MKIALSVVGIVAGILVAVYVFGKPHADITPQNFGVPTPADLALDRSEVAAAFEARVNDISPTPATGDIGWVVRKIDFVEGKPAAYVEYTDTHLLLRLLVQYKAATPVDFFVLATFTPIDIDTWQIANGEDVAKDKELITYKYDLESGEWVEE